MLDGVKVLGQIGDMSRRLRRFARDDFGFDGAHAFLMLLALLGTVRLSAAGFFVAHGVAPIRQTLCQHAVQRAF